MRILIATGIYPPQIGGPATYSKLLYDELPKRGISVEIASFGDYLARPKLVRHVLYFLSLLGKAKNADLIYAQDPVSVGLPALLASQISGKKLVLKIVGDYAWEQGSQRFGVTDSLDDFSRAYQKYSPQVRTLKKIEKYVADGADSIVTPSEYLKKIITNWGVNGSKVKVIYNGFHMSETKMLKSSLRRELGLKHPTVITVGRLVPWKGIQTLIESMTLLHSTVPDAELVVAGDGPDREALEKRASQLGLSDKVRFAGRLSQPELWKYIKASDVFVLNTSYEGFSHQLLETMALGTPIITTKVGGNPEAIEDGKTGILVRPNDKEALVSSMSSLLMSKAAAQKLARAAKTSVGRFTDSRMLDEIAAHLTSI